MPLDWNAILVPSGEIFGLTPDTGSGVFVPAARSNRQIFPPQTYAIFPASPAAASVSAARASTMAHAASAKFRALRARNAMRSGFFAEGFLELISISPHSL